MGQNKVDIHELNISNKEFWFSFLAVSYPNGYDEETDMSVDDLVGEYADVQWWDEFTGYDEELFEIMDGYSETPTTVEVRLDDNRNLTVEFHPGDILYFINGEQIGSTGPHWKLQVFGFNEIENLLTQENGVILFWLLLPLAKVDKDVEMVERKLSEMLETFFESSDCNEIAKCVVKQLMEEEV